MAINCVLVCLVYLLVSALFAFGDRKLPATDSRLGPFELAWSARSCTHAEDVLGTKLDDVVAVEVEFEDGALRYLGTWGRIQE